MEEKRTGYILLGVGLFTMILAVSIVVLLFTGNMKPAQVINIPAPTLNTGSLIPHIPGLPKPQGEKIEILPTRQFNTIVNLGIQFLLMTFIMSFGFKLADLGVKLLRPIKMQGK